MKVVRILAIAIGAVFGLIIVAGIVVALLFDPNDYKEQVQAYVQERTGRSLQIHDDIELSIFPWLAVETGRVELGNAAGFGDEPFVAAQRASARVRLIPLLLRREFEIGTVRLDGLELDLAVAGDGTNNWSDFSAASVAQDDQSGATDAEPAGSGAADALAALDIAGIELRGARIVWREDGAPRYVVSELSLSTGAVRAAEPVDLEAEFDVLEVATQRTFRIEAATVAALGSNGAVSISDNSIAFSVIDGNGNTDAQGTADFASLSFAPGDSLRVTAAAIASTVAAPMAGAAPLATELNFSALELDLAGMNVTIDDLVASANDIEARWQLVGENLAGDAAVVRGSVIIADSAAAAALELGGITLPDGISAADLGSFSASTGFVIALGPQEIELSNTEFTMLGVDVRAQQAAMRGETLSAQLDVTPFRPNAALRRLLTPYVPEGVSLEPLSTIAFSGRLAGTPDNMALTGMRFTGLGAQISGSLQLQSAANGMRISGDVATNRFATAEIFAVAGSLVPESISPETAGTAALSGRFAWDAGAGTLQLDGLTVEAFGLRGAGAVAATGLGQSAEFSGRIQLEDFSPRELLDRFGLAVPQTSDDTALAAANVSTRFEVSPTAASFSDLVVRLDDSRINGSFVVSEFDDPFYRFTLAADRLDVDRYLPPQTPAGADAEVADTGERRAGDMELSNEALSAINVDASVSVGALRMAGMDFSNVATSLVVGQGRMLIDSAHADLYGGSFDGRFHVDASGAVPTMLLQGNTAGLQLTPLITALAGSASFSGTGNFDIDLRGRGPTVTDNLRSAGGTMGFELTNGAIEGFNIDKTLCRAFNRVRGNAAPANVADRTQFQVIRGTATVTDGIAATNDLYAVAGSAEVRGAGTLAIADQIVDYDFEARVARAVQIQGCQEMERIVGHDFPLQMRGPLTAPEISPDYSEVIRRVLQYRIQEEVRDRILDRILN